MKRSILLMFVLLLSATNIFSQSTPKFNIYHTDVSDFPKVRLHYTAQSRVGFVVSEDNLTIDHFNGTEDGRDLSDLGLNKVCGDLEYDLPMSAVIILDATLSMQDLTQSGARRIDWVKKAANRFNDSLKYNEGSATALVSFAAQVHLSTGWKFTREEIKSEIDGIDLFIGNTNFNPAFTNQSQNGAIDLLKQRPPNSKRVIVFLTDGLHTNQANDFQWETFKDSCLANDITVYTVALDVDETINELRYIADETGGEHIRTDDLTDLEEFYDKIYLETQSGKDKCWLEYNTSLSCAENVSEREVSVNFTYYDPQIVNSTVRYNPPEDKLISLTSNKDVLYFDTENNGLTTQTIQLTAENGDFTNLSFEVVPADGNFQVDFAKSNMSDGETINADITFLDNGGSGNYELIITSDNCPSAPITLIAPCGGDVPADIAFDQVPSNSQQTRTITFTNNGTAELIGLATIQGVDAGLFEITQGAEEFTLNPTESHEVIVRFNATNDGNYNAYINWDLNEGCGAPRTNITANVVSFGVELVPFDFGTHRVQSTFGPQSVLLRNIGTAPITVTDLQWEDISMIDFTGLPEIQNSVTLAAGEELDMQITFNPQSVGRIENSIIVSLEGEDIDPRATLTGTGTLPEIEADPLTFPDTDLNVTANAQTLVITNNSTTEDLLISEILFEAGSNDNNEFAFVAGAQLNNISIPQNGGTHEIDLEFTPRFGGNRTARIEILNNTVIGDASQYQSYFVNVNGIGIGDDSFTIPVNTSDFGNVFACGSRDLDFTFENTSDQQRQFNIAIQGDADGVFAINGNTTVDLAAGETYTVNVSFLPTDQTVFNANLIVTSTDGAGYGEAQLTGTGISEDLTVSIANIYGAKTEFEPGEDFDLNFDVQIPQLFRGDLDQLTISLQFNNKQLNFDENAGLTLPNGWTVDPAQVENLGNSVYKYTYQISGNALITPGTISGNFRFSTLLYNVDENQLTITAESPLTCLDLGSNFTNVRVNGCVNELMDIFANNLGIEPIAPNPVSTDISLRYNVPFDNARTQIMVYDQTGTLVLNILDKVHSSGSYEFTLPVTNMNSGLYFLYYVCADMTKTQKLIISK